MTAEATETTETTETAEATAKAPSPAQLNAVAAENDLLNQTVLQASLNHLSKRAITLRVENQALRVALETSRARVAELEQFLGDLIPDTDEAAESPLVECGPATNVEGQDATQANLGVQSPH